MRARRFHLSLTVNKRRVIATNDRQVNGASERAGQARSSAWTEGSDETRQSTRKTLVFPILRIIRDKASLPRDIPDEKMRIMHESEYDALFSASIAPESRESRSIRFPGSREIGKTRLSVLVTGTKKLSRKRVQVQQCSSRLAAPTSLLAVEGKRV